LKIDNIDVNAAIDKVKLALQQEHFSPELKTTLEMLLLLVTALLHRVTLNSSTSSKPPSSDPNRKKTTRRKSSKPSGGQPGHVGTQLKPVAEPDEIRMCLHAPDTLPPGEYQLTGYEKRQVIELDITRRVIEYQAQVLSNAQGQRFVAPFPKTVKRPIQYGASIKAHAVYLSQFQLLPYQRIRDYFNEQIQFPLSEGSLFNFNQTAYAGLALFDRWVKQQLLGESLLHSDETGVNINGQRLWLHTVCSPSFSYFYPHAKRGTEAMAAMGILPRYAGILCHDHWKPYYRYDCHHALCNAHHLRELERAYEQDQQYWAKDMQDLLIEIKHAVCATPEHVLSPDEAAPWRMKYHALLDKAENECPPPDERLRPEGKRGRLKRSKARNLLERLRDYEDDVLRFMTLSYVPFTNNLAENDLRMVKVQQKISGCFRSMEGAKIFCRIRSYLLTCQKHDVSATKALSLLFQGSMPEFMECAE